MMQQAKIRGMGGGMFQMECPKHAGNFAMYDLDYWSAVVCPKCGEALENPQINRPRQQLRALALPDSDFFKWRDFLDSQGVAHDVEVRYKGENPGFEIIIEGGYSGFFFDVSFDRNGKLKETGSYEA